MGLTGEEMGDHAVSFARSMGVRDPEVARVLGIALASDRMDDALMSTARDAVGTLAADSVFTLRNIAALYTNLGDRESALEWLETSSAEVNLSLVLAGVDPAFDPLRDDPRMQRLMDDLGLPNGYDPAADVYEPGADVFEPGAVDFKPELNDSRAEGLR